MYCTTSELKTYLGITGSGDDTLLGSLVQAARQMIDDSTRRSFEATADSTRYFDALQDVDGLTLDLCGDLSYIESVTLDGGTVPASEYVPFPRNKTPWESLKIKSTSAYGWVYTLAHEDAIAVSGRWAAMHSKPVSAVARSSNTVTATVPETSELAVGATVYLAGVADSSFNGQFTLTAVTATSVSWAQSGTNDTDTTGTLLYTPASIRQACLRLAAFLYRQKDNQSGDQDRTIVTESGIIMPAALPKDVSEMLRPWIKIR